MKIKIKICTKSTILHKIADPQNFIDCVCNMINLNIDPKAILNFTRLDFRELQNIKRIIVNNQR